MGRSWETAVRDSSARYMKKKHAWSATPKSTHGFDAALQTMGRRRSAAESVTSPTDRMPLESMTRSEERRVGKECRSGWTQCHRRQSYDIIMTDLGNLPCTSDTYRIVR